MPTVRLCAVLLLLAGIAGCDRSEEPASPPPKPTFANWPETLDGSRFRWSAEPGIDLPSGPAVPLRAYLESHRVGDFTLDIDATYPGFQRAVPEGPPNDDLHPDEPNQLRWIRPFTDPKLAFGPPGPFYGNEYFHILELNPIEGGYRAYVCDGLYNVFREGENPGTYVPVHRPTEGYPNPDDLAIELWRVEFTDHPTPPDPAAPPMVTAAQRGPNPAPLGDVFGPWHITGASPNAFWGSPYDSELDPRYRPLKHQCLDKMPHDAAQRGAHYASELDTPPTAEPAVPGWPEKTA